ncbi:MAG: hypothetical protein QXZ20_04405, partial [Candidatus Aenigmatarchaeota archaeon]
ATSSLDLESERFILLNIKKYYPATTVIFVSHRPSILKEAEVVCYFENSNSVIVDSFNNLLNYSGFKEFLNLC